MAEKPLEPTQPLGEKPFDLGASDQCVASRSGAPDQCAAARSGAPDQCAASRPGASDQCAASRSGASDQCVAARSGVSQPDARPRTALMFEGGGMRASHSAGVAVALLEENLSFDLVCGISAGSSCTVNYLLGDPERTRKSFVELGDHPLLGNWGTWLRGKGLFSAHWIYQEACLPDGYLPFDFDRFQANPTPMAIQALDALTGESVVWSRGDVHTLDDLMVRVRASSTLPVLMPPVRFDGRLFFDGGLGAGSGIPLRLATEGRDGCQRVLGVLTRPRGYRKQPPGFFDRVAAARYACYPPVSKSLLGRYTEYNAELERLEQMERDGSAFLLVPKRMEVSSGTRDVAALRSAFDDGYALARECMPELIAWLGR